MEKGFLKYGPLTRSAAHLCIDMQNIYADATPWQAPWMKRILPVVENIARHRPAETIFTRFIPPQNVNEASGAWKRYYEHWSGMTREQIDPRLLRLIPSLEDLVPPASVFDKMVYSPFANHVLHRELMKRGIDTLVLTGAETDMCVLAAVIAAVDLGYRVILVRDAICSSSDGTHDALVKLYEERFTHQIETCDSETVLASWL